MRQVEVYTFNELPEEAQDYIIDNFDTKRNLREVLNLVSQWEQDAADAQWNIDKDIALDFADNKNISVDEDYLDDFNPNDFQHEIEWSKVIDPVVFEVDGKNIELDFENKKSECIIKRSISDNDFRRLPHRDRKEIKTFEANVKKFATMVLDAIHNCQYYELPEDDLRYALGDAGLEYIVKDSGEVRLI